MKVPRTIYVAIAFVIFAALPAMAAVITLDDGAYHQLNGIYSEVAVYDTGQNEPTTVELVTGGIITDLLIWGNSCAVLSGGRVDSDLAAYDNSNVSMTGGYIACLWPVHNSTVAMSGGLVGYASSYDSSVLNISGGEISHLRINEGSKVTISGGNFPYVQPKANSLLEITDGVFGSVWPWDSSMTVSGGDLRYVSIGSTSHLNMRGGDINDLWGWETTTIDIFGGSVSNLRAKHSSVITLHGYDFVAMGGLSFSGEQVLGIGILSGKWHDGTPWTMRITEHDSTALIIATGAPEPSTLGLLAFGSLAMLRRWRHHNPYIAPLR